MSELKPFASLSSSLLARKGTAKPAMRPQGFGHFGGQVEDLGWNDMGHEPAAEHVPSSIAALTPAPRIVDDAPQASQDEVQAAETWPEVDPLEVPVVEQQRAEIEARLASPEPEPQLEAEQEDIQPQREPVSLGEIVPIPTRRQAGAKAKAAFTLRLDPERHLKLRLACAVGRRSAQQLVTEALDSYLASIPGIDALVDRVPVGKR